MQMPPGWYPDPWRVAVLRWWDGVQWTADVPPGAGVVHPSAFAVDVPAARSSEEGLWRWARAAVCAFGVLAVAELLALIFLGAEFGREARKILSTVPGGPPPRVDVSGIGWVAVTVDAAQLFTLLVGIVFLMWQYHTAKVARGLGYPARTTPGLGVGSWFIPILNLWYPYWALTDCLPPAHRLRATTIWAWGAYIAAQVLTAATLLVAVFSTLVALVPLVLALASVGTAVVLGYRLVTAVNEDHRRAVGEAGA